MDRTKKNIHSDWSAKAPFTTRLTFSYSGDKIKLISKKTIQKKLPASDRLTTRKVDIGFWYEVKDAKNTTIFRRVMQNPIKKFAEIRSDNANRPFTWEKVDNPTGVFMIQFPEMKEAVEVVFYSIEPKEGLKSALRRVVTRYSLKNNKIRKED